ncbi:MAG: hypothetical protein NZ898_11625, partial [Myxococcota bacterium]|nr:hypothetical protein [Myxococcota bacterium]
MAAGPHRRRAAARNRRRAARRSHLARGRFETPTRILDRVRILDPRTGRWSDGPALPAPRHHLVLVAHGGDLYALGGMRDLSFEPLESAWVLRAGASSWTPIAPLPEPRAAGTGASLAGHVLYAGGLTRGGRVAADVLRYDPATDRWTRGAPMPTPREHLGGGPGGRGVWGGPAPAGPQHTP